MPHSPAISCLGAFPTPVSERVAGLVIAGVRKPAQTEKNSVGVYLFRIASNIGLSMSALAITRTLRSVLRMIEDAHEPRAASSPMDWLWLEGK